MNAINVVAGATKRHLLTHLHEPGFASESGSFLTPG